MFYPSSVDGSDLVGWSEAFDGNTCQNFTDTIALVTFRETMEGVLGMTISLQTRHALFVEHAALVLVSEFMWFDCIW
jgi:hypothetical protein